MRTGGTVAAAPLVASLLLVVLHGGGSRPEWLVPVAAVALIGAGIMLALASWGRLPWPEPGRPGTVLVAALAAYVVWGGASTAWSIAPDRSWGWLNRGLVYLAFLALGVVVAAAVPRARSLVALALAAVAGIALLWALAGVVVPDLGPDVERSARLREPVGYWNALALVLVVGIPPALWLAVDAARRPWLRAAAVAGIAGALVAVALTGSRGGLVAAVVAAAVWLALSRQRLEGGLALALAAAAAALVSLVTLPLPGIGDAGASLADRRRDGAVLGLALLVALAVVALVWARVARRSLSGRARAATARALVVAAAAVLAVGIAGAAVATARSGPICNAPNRQLTQDAGRILETSFNNRCTWWRDAVNIWVDEPLAGTGAGTFELARRPLREDTQHPLAPHNLALQALSETGIVGLALLVAAAAAALWVLARAIRDGERAAAVVLAASLAAWGAHALVDMAWEYPAVTAPAFAALGVLAARPRAERAAAAARRPLVALGAAGLALTALASVVSPWLAERRLDEAADAVVRGDLAAADRGAADAHSLNPLSTSPLQFRAAVAEADDRPDDALALLREAVELQPRNPELWYALGRHYLDVRRDAATAFCAADRAYALDSWDLGTNDLVQESRRALDGRVVRCRYDA